MLICRTVNNHYPIFFGFKNSILPQFSIFKPTSLSFTNQDIKKHLNNFILNQYKLFRESQLHTYLLMFIYSILFNHSFINLIFLLLSLPSLKLSNVIYILAYFQGSKNGVLLPFFDPYFVFKPLHVVVNFYFLLSEPQYVIRIILST